MASIFESMNPFAAGSPISALTGEYGLLTNPTGAWDKFKNGNTNEVNKEIAEQNLAFQRENLDYNRALNERIFERADTAHQREVADLRAAGLNPLIATAGAETAGSATPTEALHNDYKHQDMGTLSAFQSIGDLLNTLQNFQIGFDYGREQKAKADSATAQATVDKQTAMDKIFGSHLDWENKKLLFSDLNREEYYNSYFHINKGMSDEERMARILSKALEDKGAYDETGFGHTKIKENKNGTLEYGFYDNDKPSQAYSNMAANLITSQVAGFFKDLVPDIQIGPKGIPGKK